MDVCRDRGSTMGADEKVSHLVRQQEGLDQGQALRWTEIARCIQEPSLEQSIRSCVLNSEDYRRLFIHGSAAPT